MSGVPVQSTRRDTGMCTKAVTASYCCQCWRLSSPQKSQLAHCGCLIFNTTVWLSFPPHLTVFELRFEICKRSGKVCGFVTRKHSLFQWLTFDALGSPQQYRQELGCSVTVIFVFARPDRWWDLGVYGSYQQQEEMGEVCCSWTVRTNKQNAN